jgi:hypothetical protein
MTKDAAHSLAKRVDAELRVEFSRILADRQILTWLEEHRSEWPALAKIPGGLRKAIAEEMERRGDLQNLSQNAALCHPDEDAGGAHGN